MDQTVKRLSTMWETWVRSLSWEDPLEKEMAIHSSTIAWKIPRTEQPGRLQSMGSQRVGHDWATSLHCDVPWCSYCCISCAWGLSSYLNLWIYILHECEKKKLWPMLLQVFCRYPILSVEDSSYFYIRLLEDVLKITDFLFLFY